MRTKVQTFILTSFALVVFLMLRLLPDTQCTFLHINHEPVIIDGLEFCGTNEESNFYSPSELRFPVRATISLSSDRFSASLRLTKEDGRLYYGHEVAISHTEQVHLHLRNSRSDRQYAHIHPKPDNDGSWKFEIPPYFSTSEIDAYVDFTDIRTSRVMLAETSFVSYKAENTESTVPLKLRNRISKFDATTYKSGASSLIRVKISAVGAKLLKLKPIMGTLGHAIIFSTDNSKSGYAHMHPTLMGEEYEANPTLSFRIRLPKPGTYDFWLNINDGEPELLRYTLVVIP